MAATAGASGEPEQRGRGLSAAAGGIDSREITVAEYQATIDWERNGAEFVGSRYSRAHRWEFDGGVHVPASASPHVVPAPYSVAAAVDPEEAFVAALSSCHMLWFLSIACKRGFVVDRYRDAASGTMGRDGEGRLAMLDVTLRPSVTFGGTKRPSAAEVDELHHAAHAECFIASSVKTRVHCEPV
jgi:organic hydroperoxide reductase OsmC/OhrA